MENLDPAHLVAPLLKAPLISPPSAYALIHAISGGRNMKAVVHHLLTWTRVLLKSTAPGVPILGALDLEDHLTGVRKLL